MGAPIAAELVGSAKDQVAAASGAAAQAQANIVKSASLTKLRRLMSSAKQFNASDASALPSSVTITPQASVTSGLNAQSRPVTDASADTIFTVLGGVKLVSSSTMWRFWCITRPVSGGNVDATHTNQCARVAWETDSDNFDIRVDGLPAQPYNGYRLLVDGQYVTKSMLVPYATAGQCYFNVKPASRRWRRYDLEVMKNGAFGGLHFSKADSIRPVDPTQIFRVAVYGDSITETVGTTISGNGYAYHLGRRLGNMNVDLWGIGMTSTGYYNPGTDPGNSTCKFIDHIDDLTHAQFDMVVFAGGTNEIGTPALTLQAAAIACWQAARLRCPNAIIAVLGSFVSATNNAGSLGRVDKRLQPQASGGEIEEALEG